MSTPSFVSAIVRGDRRLVDEVLTENAQALYGSGLGVSQFAPLLLASQELYETHLRPRLAHLPEMAETALVAFIDRERQGLHTAAHTTLHNRYVGAPSAQTLVPYVRHVVAHSFAVSAIKPVWLDATTVPGDRLDVSMDPGKPETLGALLDLFIKNPWYRHKLHPKYQNDVTVLTMIMVVVVRQNVETPDEPASFFSYEETGEAFEYLAEWFWIAFGIDVNSLFPVVLEKRWRRVASHTLVDIPKFVADAVQVDDFTLHLPQIDSGSVSRDGEKFVLVLRFPIPDVVYGAHREMDFNAVVLWNRRAGTVIRLLVEEGSGMADVVTWITQPGISPDGNFVVTGTHTVVHPQQHTAVLRIWDGNTGVLIKRIDDMSEKVPGRLSDSILNPLMLADGTRIVFHSMDDVIIFNWETATEITRYKLEQHPGFRFVPYDTIAMVAATPDGKTIVVGTTLSEVVLANDDVPLPQPRVFAKLYFHPTKLRSIAISGDGQKIVSTGDLGESTTGGEVVLSSTRMWEMKINGVKMVSFKNSERYSAISTDGRTIMSDGGDGLRVWNGTVESGGDSRGTLLRHTIHDREYVAGAIAVDANVVLLLNRHKKGFTEYNNRWDEHLLVPDPWPVSLPPPPVHLRPNRGTIEKLRVQFHRVT